MSVVECPRCGNRFETAARSGRTRCGNCRAAVSVPGGRAAPASARSTEHRIAVVRLSCGHADAVIVHPGRSVRSATAELDFDCPDIGTAKARVARVVAVYSEVEWEALTEEEIGTLIEGAR